MERRNFSLNTFLGVIILIVVALVFGGLLIFEKIDSDKRASEFNEQQTQIRQEKREKEEKIKVEIDKVKAVVDNELPRIVCWGDEYMLGTKTGTLPANLKTELNEKLFEDINKDIRSNANLSSKQLQIDVVNNGIRGETMYTMAARIGAYPILTAKKLELPKGTDPVAISLKTNDDKSVNFSSQPNVKIGECTLEDEVGTISMKKLSEDEYEYYFSKNKVSEPKTVAVDTRLFSQEEETHRDDVLILYFGREDLLPRKDLIEIQKAVVNHQNAHRDKYVVIAETGRGSGYDKAMQKQFGDHYLRLDTYEYDQTDNKEIADAVYNKLEALGYLKKISDAATTAKQQISEIEK